MQNPYSSTTASRLLPNVTSSELPRRHLLALAGAALLSACGGGGSPDAASVPAPAPAPVPAPAPAPAPAPLSVVAGSASGSGADEQVIGEFRAMTIDPSTGALVVHSGSLYSNYTGWGIAYIPYFGDILASSGPSFITRYPMSGGQVNLTAGQQTTLSPIVPFGVAVDGVGNAYVGAVIDPDVSYPFGGPCLRPWVGQGDIEKIGANGAVTPLFNVTVNVGSFKEIYSDITSPGDLVAMDDGSLLFLDRDESKALMHPTNSVFFHPVDPNSNSVRLMRWVSGQGLAVLATLGKADVFTGKFLMKAPQGGVYWIEHLEPEPQNFLVPQVFRLSKWDSRTGVTKVTDFVRSVEQGISFVSAASDAQGRVALATNVSTIILVTPDGKVSTLAGQQGITGLQTGALPGVLGKRLGPMTFAPDGSLLVVSDTALLRIQLPQ